MKDITPLMDHYRECVRHLWNSGILTIDIEMDDTQIWYLRDVYAEIASQLSNAMIFRQIGYDHAALAIEYMSEHEPLANIYVVPAFGEAVIYINRNSPPSGYWDKSVGNIKTEDVELKLIRYFDYDVIGSRELEYYLVCITDFNKHPDLIGRNALVRVKETRVLFSDDAAPVKDVISEN